MIMANLACQVACAVWRMQLAKEWIVSRAALWYNSPWRYR